MPIGKIPPPAQHPDEEELVCIPVNIEWIPIILGALQPLKYPEYWAGTLDENRRARKDFGILIDQIMQALECGEMATCCVEPYIIQRVNPVTGALEISTNNGDTWQPKPNTVKTKIIDPVPPVTSGLAATKCDAATNAMAQIQDWIDHVTTAFDVATGVTDFAILVAAAILDAVLLILSEETLTAVEAQIIEIIGAICTAVWETGKSVFADYWTSEVKDKILCAMFAFIGDDGSFTDDQFNNVWERLSSELPNSIAKSLFLGFLSNVGRQGLNAMAATGASAEADCAGCDVTCNQANWDIVTFSGQPVGSILSRGLNYIIVEGLGHPDFGTPYNAMIQTASDTDCCVIASVEYLTGDDSDEHEFGVKCSDPRWPASGNNFFVMGVDSLNTLYLRKDSGSGFTAKITFV